MVLPCGACRGVRSALLASPKVLLSGRFRAHVSSVRLVFPFPGVDQGRKAVVGGVVVEPEPVQNVHEGGERWFGQTRFAIADSPCRQTDQLAEADDAEPARASQIAKKGGDVLPDALPGHELPGRCDGVKILVRLAEHGINPSLLEPVAAGMAAVIAWRDMVTTACMERLCERVLPLWLGMEAAFSLPGKVGRRRGSLVGSRGRLRALFAGEGMSRATGPCRLSWRQWPHR